MKAILLVMVVCFSLIGTFQLSKTFWVFLYFYVYQPHLHKSRTYANNDSPLVRFSSMMSFERLIEANVFLDVVENIKQVKIKKLER